MYILMNKDVPILKIKVTDGILDKTYDVEEIYHHDLLPYGFESPQNWLENRKGSKHNKHLKELMRVCGCDKIEGFIKFTHAASLIDTFWVKEETESLTWSDVSFYTHEFNAVVSKLAFEGVGLYGIQLSNTSPELSTDGSFPKCWRRENNQIYLYKRGTSGYANSGLEPYCEAMASELANHLLRQNAITYDLCKIHDQIASKCKLFTSEKEGYVPMVLFGEKKNWTANSLFEYFYKLGSEDIFRRMLVFDAISFNVDRHLGNIGVFVNNDTLQPQKIAPIFDFNLSLLPYASIEELKHPGDYLLTQGPKIGEDFVEIAKKSMTPAIKAELINMKGTHFSFQGDDNFSPDRVYLIENLVNHQISAVLNREIFYTKDAFPISKEKEQEIRLHDTCQQLQNTLNVNTDLYFSMDEENSILISTFLDNDTAKDVDIVIDVKNKNIKISTDKISDCLQEVLTKIQNQIQDNAFHVIYDNCDQDISHDF